MIAYDHVSLGPTARWSLSRQSTHMNDSMAESELAGSSKIILHFESVNSFG
jgi:hypothetical protein